MQEYILTGINVLSFVFIVLSVLVMIKIKKFEDLRLGNGFKVLILGFFFLGLFLLINVIRYLNTIFQFVQENYLSYLFNIEELILIPLFAICFLAAIILFKENIKL
jgi:hypothetical protein